MEHKYDKLKIFVRGLSRVAVAFSGGVDSTLLLKVCVDVLGPENVVALTAYSPLVPEDEMNRALNMTKDLGVTRHLMVDTPDIEDKNIKHNPEDRCYHCKKMILTAFLKILEDDFEKGYQLLEGSNKDDTGEHRPGRRAVRELNVYSPLTEAGLTKDEIRELSKESGLTTWDLPSQSCLATRFPYGKDLSKEELDKVNEGESYLKELGSRECRLRIHGSTARIEVPRSERNRLISNSSKIVEKLKSLGYTYVTLDMEGLRSGSMDERNYT